MKRKARPRILIVNDDGIHGEGLNPLIEAMNSIGQVTVLVPERERSAESHSLTLHKPLRIREVAEGIHTLNGKPADCARLGVLKLMRGRVDLLVSGINRGYNLGQDTLYSGTVAAAAEGSVLNVPSIALSQGYSKKKASYGPIATFAQRLAKRVLRSGLPRGVCLNVNAPAIAPDKVRGIKVARLGERVYDKKVTLRKDPIGRTYCWLVGRFVGGRNIPGTDVAAVQAGYISMTPLQIDMTDRGMLKRLKTWKF